MNCFKCDRPAHGICKFCGRGVCKDHHQTGTSIIDSYMDKGHQYVLVVKDSLRCSFCNPEEEYIDLTKED